MTAEQEGVTELKADTTHIDDAAMASTLDEKYITKVGHMSNV